MIIAYAGGVERVYFIPTTRWGSISGEKEIGCAVKNKEDFVSFTIQEKPYLLEITYWEKKESYFLDLNTYHRLMPDGYNLKETVVFTEVEAKWKDFFVTAIDVTVKRKGKFRTLIDLTMDIYATPFNDGQGHYRSKFTTNNTRGSSRVVEQLVCRSIASGIDSKERLIESKIYNELQPAFKPSEIEPSTWKVQDRDTPQFSTFPPSYSRPSGRSHK